MKKNWLLVVFLASVLLLVGLTGCTQGGAALGSVEGLNISNQQQGIWVTGEGKVMAAPDIATLRLGIEAQETTVAQAQSDSAEAMNNVLAALQENGVADKDIQTQYFSIRKVTKWDREKEEEVIIGYRVTNMVTAKIRDIDNTGTIIDAVAKAGGDLTRIDNISFSVDDPSPYYEEAREKAVAEAKDKAYQLADLAGVSLGKPSYISEGTTQVPPIYRGGLDYAEAVPAAPETPISPGELEIRLSVQIVYAIH